MIAMPIHMSPIPEVGKIVHYGQRVMDLATWTANAVMEKEIAEKSGRASSVPVDPKDGDRIEPWAAIIVKIHEDRSINLFVFKAELSGFETMLFYSHIPYSESLKPKHWSWPPSVMQELEAALWR